MNHHILMNSQLTFQEILSMPITEYRELYYSLTNWGNFMRGDKLNLQSMEDQQNQVKWEFEQCENNKLNWTKENG